MLATQPAESHRAREIDGIRGWAALTVLVFHVFDESLGAVLSLPRSPAFWWLINGHFAVFVFFILSGDALSIGYVRSGQRFHIDSLALRRYTRLMIPVALSSTLVYLLMSMGWTPNREAGLAVGSQNWLGSFIQFAPTFRSLLRFVLIEVYAPLQVYSAPVANYNPMLWTMSIEMAGSFLVFVFLYLSGALKYPVRTLAVVCVALLAYGSFFGLFFFGMLLTHARRSGLLDSFRSQRVWGALSPLLAVCILFVAGTFHVGTGSWRNAYLVCACAFVWCCYTGPGAIRFFKTRFSQWLGDISFALYLVHFAVLVSLTSWMIIHAGVLDGPRLVAIGAVSVVASLGLGVIFVRVEKAILGAVDRLLLAGLKSKRPTSPPPVDEAVVAH